MYLWNRSKKFLKQQHFLSHSNGLAFVRWDVYLCAKIESTTNVATRPAPAQWTWINMQYFDGKRKTSNWIAFLSAVNWLKDACNAHNLARVFLSQPVFKPFNKCDAVEKKKLSMHKHLTWHGCCLHTCYVISHGPPMPNRTNKINVSSKIWTENKSSVCKTIKYQTCSLASARWTRAHRSRTLWPLKIHAASHAKPHTA